MVKATGIATVLMLVAFASHTAQAAESGPAAKSIDQVAENLPGPGQQARIEIHFDQELVPKIRRIAPTQVSALAHRVRQDAPEVSPIIALLTTSNASGLGYVLTRGFSFGIGYDYVTDEDLAFEVAATGSLNDDYKSHKVMVRAHWRF